MAALTINFDDSIGRLAEKICWKLDFLGEINAKSR